MLSAVVLGATIGVSTGTSGAAPLKFDNCTEMNKRFPSGLAPSPSVATRAQSAGYERPQVNRGLYIQVKDSSPGLRVTRPGVLCPVAEVAQPPGPVMGLIVRSVARDSLVLEWRPPAARNGPRVSSYLVEGPGSITVNGTRASVTGLTPDTAVEYQVSAVSSAGVGVASKVTATTLPPPVLFQVPPVWENPDNWWEPPGTTYLQYHAPEGTVLYLSNAPQLIGDLRATICSGSWYKRTSGTIQFIDANGAPVVPNAVTGGRPDLTKPDPYPRHPGTVGLF